MVDRNLYFTKVPNNLDHENVRNYDPDKPRIKDILWKHYDWVKDMDSKGKSRPCVLDNIQKVLLCNTFYLGYDAFECLNCDNFTIIPRHCHSRFCTSCGVKTQKTLAAKAEVMCLDVKHRHIVFTIPEEYRLWFRKDRSSLNLLFIAARNTICKIVNENLFRKVKRKQNRSGIYQNLHDNLYLFRNYAKARQFGMISTIHTFGRALNWNPHIHALVAELVYDPVTDSYIPFHHFDFSSLRKTWQYEVNRLLSNHFGKQIKHVINTDYKDYNNGFYVYAKADPYDPDKDQNTDHSKNVKGCVNYMMRYASRPAMAESRLLSYNKDTDTVRWYYDDHKTEERIEVEEPSLELLKKMIIHIPDTNFVCTRYYGFYNNRKQKLLDKLHSMLGNVKKKSMDRHDRKKALINKLNKLRFRTHCADTFNRDVLKCFCGSEMIYYDTYNPLEGKHNDRHYRQSCIDEMRKMWLSRNGPPKRSGTS